MRTMWLAIMGFILTAGAGAAMFPGCASPPKEPVPDDYVFFGVPP